MTKGNDLAEGHHSVFKVVILGGINARKFQLLSYWYVKVKNILAFYPLKKKKLIPSITRITNSYSGFGFCLKPMAGPMFLCAVNHNQEVVSALKLPFIIRSKAGPFSG